MLQACATQLPPTQQSEAPEPAPAPAAAVTAGVPAPAVTAGVPAAPAEPPRGVKGIDRTIPAKDIWQRMRHGFAMPDLDSALVRRKTAEYARQQDYLQRMFERSRIYLYHILEELEKRGLPTELALLPMVESAFNPMAYSRAHASGLWQFVPGTGRRFELKQNWWYDGRRDIVDSTTAALDYLTYLYERHGHWHLALASYNWGENAVARAIVKNRKARKPTDYSSLHMPRETREYVPKLQALKNIIASPALYGIRLEPIPNEPYFAVVEELPDIDVALAAKLADMPVEEFIALNPGFSRPLIRSGVATRIVLPAEKVDLFHDNLAKHDHDSLVSWQVYHPKRGERLEVIAEKFAVPVNELKRVNGIASHSWRVPEVLVVPMNGNAEKSITALPIMYAPPIPVQGPVRRIHIVKRGDTLSTLAARYRVRLTDLKRWNRVGNFLQIGQRIYIR